MNDSFNSHTYVDRVRERLATVLKEGPVSFLELLRHSQGAYPTVVQQALAGLTAAVRSGPPSIVLETNAAAPETLVTVELEGNPVLSSWYFSRATCARLAAMRSWAKDNIAFYGSPRLYEWFAINRLGASRSLYDLDVTVVKALSFHRGLQDRLEVCDLTTTALQEDIGVTHVFLDPPWYTDEYYRWLASAQSLAPSATVIFPLFPALTRPTAEEEREELLRAMRLAFRRVDLFPEYVEYDIPTFERGELRAHGIELESGWKLADLVVASGSRELITTVHEVEIEPHREHWEEVDIGPTRFFLRIGQPAEAGRGVILERVTASGYLSSPSRRNPELKRVNVLTSRGHGLYTPTPQRLLSYLVSRAGRNQAAAAESWCDVDESSAALIAEVLHLGV